MVSVIYCLLTGEAYGKRVCHAHLHWRWRRTTLQNDGENAKRIFTCLSSIVHRLDIWKRAKNDTKLVSKLSKFYENGQKRNWEKYVKIDKSLLRLNKLQATAKWKPNCIHYESSATHGDFSRSYQMGHISSIDCTATISQSGSFHVCARAFRPKPKNPPIITNVL